MQWTVDDLRGSIHYRFKFVVCWLASTFTTIMMSNCNCDEQCSTEEMERRERSQFCSFPVTGTKEMFQAIYVCRSCTSSDQQLLCLCLACAEACHGEHEGLEYIGMGPAYCDCKQLAKCRIKNQSQKEADRLLIPACQQPKIILNVTNDEPYTRDVLRISVLEENSDFYRHLQRQAKRLVARSKDTFWLQASTGDGDLCDFELLALIIFRRHCEHYFRWSRDDVNGAEKCGVAGAEWWVQLKSVSHGSGSHRLLELHGKGSEAVDLHYDKDESMAESFGLGFFPALSTVTYLTDSKDAAPTLVFSHRYDQEDNENISEMLISHPFPSGKHLVFDGRLLHGAPSHYALRQQSDGPRDSRNDDVEVRITFLVNIWLDHKPVGVHVLPRHIREELRACSPSSARETVNLEAMGFRQIPVPAMELTDESQLPATLQGRIQLPFVGGKDTTWGDDEEEQEAMILATYPPPNHNSGTLLAQFGPGMEAFLD
jgi:hypothetical protein